MLLLLFLPNLIILKPLYDNRVKYNNNYAKNAILLKYNLLIFFKELNIPKIGILFPF